jgi:hypothetical protein
MNSSFLVVKKVIAGFPRRFKSLYTYLHTDIHSYTRQQLNHFHGKGNTHKHTRVAAAIVYCTKIHNRRIHYRPKRHTQEPGSMAHSTSTPEEPISKSNSKYYDGFVFSQVGGI